MSRKCHTDTKVCPRCGLEKDRATGFYKRVRGGTQSWCKDCTRLHGQGKGEGRGTIHLPAATLDAVRADARRNKLSIARWAISAVSSILRHQCEVPGCLAPAVGPERLCERDLQVTDARADARET